MLEEWIAYRKLGHSNKTCCKDCSNQPSPLEEDNQDSGKVQQDRHLDRKCSTKDIVEVRDIFNINASCVPVEYKSYKIPTTTKR